jgi:hypothetical protein
MKFNKVIQILGVLALLFGTATVFSGGKALFGGVEARAAVGDAVPFVLWFNFLAGFLYLVAGVGLFLRKPWSARVSLLLAASTIAVFAAFGFHIASGEAYETRTVAAMSIRMLFWVGVSLVAWRSLGGSNGVSGKGHRPISALTSLILAVSMLNACDKHSHDKKHNHDNPEASESSNTPVVTPDIKHDDRESKGAVKWQADATTNGGIEKMQSMVNAFDASARVEVLQDSLSKEFDLILQRCTMQGEAHEHLHHYLLPLKSRIDALEDGASSEALSEVKTYLSSYWDHFQK